MAIQVSQVGSQLGDLLGYQFRRQFMRLWRIYSGAYEKLRTERHGAYVPSEGRVVALGRPKDESGEASR